MVALMTSFPSPFVHVITNVELEDYLIAILGINSSSFGGDVPHVTGRSLLGLPKEDPLLGGTADSLVVLGDVSSKGTVVDSKDGDMLVYVRHNVNERRWKRSHQSYHHKYLLTTLDRRWSGKLLTSS
jgi:hypothetical protein